MKRTINIYGFEVIAEYHLIEGDIEVKHVSVTGGVSPTVLDGMDLLTEAKEILTSELLEEDDLMFEGEDLKPSKPF